MWSASLVLFPDMYWCLLSTFPTLCSWFIPFYLQIPTLTTKWWELRQCPRRLKQDEVLYDQLVLQIYTFGLSHCSSHYNQNKELVFLKVKRAFPTTYFIPSSLLQRTITLSPIYSFMACISCIRTFSQFCSRILVHSHFVNKYFNCLVL